MKERFKHGDVVKAFVPGTFGVIKQGKVTSVGAKYLWIDFGLVGTKRTPMRDVTEVVERAPR